MIMSRGDEKMKLARSWISVRKIQDTQVNAQLRETGSWEHATSPVLRVTVIVFRVR